MASGGIVLVYARVIGHETEFLALMSSLVVNQGLLESTFKMEDTAICGSTKCVRANLTRQLVRLAACSVCGT